MPYTEKCAYTQTLFCCTFCMDDIHKKPKLTLIIHTNARIQPTSMTTTLCQPTRIHRILQAYTISDSECVFLLFIFLLQLFESLLLRYVVTRWRLDATLSLLYCVLLKLLNCRLASIQWVRRTPSHKYYVALYGL